MGVDNFLEGDSILKLRTEVQEVNLILTITDHHRHFVQNLTPNDIVVQDNGESPEKITFFESQTQLPLRAAILIDSSDSVSYCFDFEKHAAESFLKRVLRSPSDLAMVVGFTDKARIAQGLTSNHELLSGAIRRLPTGGYTAIYDAVALASRELATIRDAQPSRRAIILLTDGEDNSSKITLQKAGEIAQQDESIVYVLNASSAWSNDKKAEREMRQLSDVTGGQYLRANDEDRIRQAFSKIATELRNQYAVAYKPAHAEPDGSFHRISVLVPKKLNVRHRLGYFAR